MYNGGLIHLILYLIQYKNTYPYLDLFKVFFLVKDILQKDVSVLDGYRKDQRINSYHITGVEKEQFHNR